MLVLNDVSELGDKKLDLKESVTKFKEENLALAAKNKLPNQTELENPERAFGPRLAWQEVIYRLRKCNHNLIFMDGLPGAIAIYCVLPNEEGTPEKRYVGGFFKEPLAEWGYVTVDEHGLPKREKRGWRAVLINMVEAHAITYKSAVEHFGEAYGQHSRIWHEALRHCK